MQNEYRQAIEQYRQKVVTLARYSLRSAADAEDIAQEVFVKLWHHWPSVDADRRLAWLMRVTHNAVIDFTRRRKTKLGVFDEAAEVEEQAGDDDQHCAAETAAIRGDIAAAIRELDDPFRSILVMRDVQGLAYADIEVSLEMNASQVKVYLHRARRKLRQNAQLRQRFDDLD
jgi:RNA polymerase sigma-70 factor (ECF subfamily)